MTPIETHDVNETRDTLKRRKLNSLPRKIVDEKQFSFYAHAVIPKMFNRSSCYLQLPRQEKLVRNEISFHFLFIRFERNYVS